MSAVILIAADCVSQIKHNASSTKHIIDLIFMFHLYIYLKMILLWTMLFSPHKFAAQRTKDGVSF